MTTIYKNAAPIAMPRPLWRKSLYLHVTQKYEIKNEFYNFLQALELDGGLCPTHLRKVDGDLSSARVRWDPSVKVKSNIPKILLPFKSKSNIASTLTF